MISLRKKEIVIPVHPTINDMVEVNGNDNETWLGHVISVNIHTKTCQVHFYIKSNSGTGYVRETRGRHCLEVVSWNSLLKVAAGFWQGNTYHYNS